MLQCALLRFNTVGVFLYAFFVSLVLIVVLFSIFIDTKMKIKYQFQEAKLGFGQFAKLIGC